MLEKLTERELQSLIEDVIRGKVSLESIDPFEDGARKEYWKRDGVYYTVVVRGRLDRTVEAAWREIPEVADNA